MYNLTREHIAKIQYLAKQISPRDWEDLAQSAIIKMGNFDPTQSTYNYFKVILERVKVDRLRRNNSRIRAVTLDSVDEPSVVSSQEINEAINMAGLRPDEMDIIRVIMIGSVSLATYAKINHVPAGTIKSRLSRIRGRFARKVPPA